VQILWRAFSSAIKLAVRVLANNACGRLKTIEMLGKDNDGSIVWLLDAILSLGASVEECAVRSFKE
jgi:hypothetical protein